MRFRLRMVVELEYEVEQWKYGKAAGNTQAMREIDRAGVIQDPSWLFKQTGTKVSVSCQEVKSEPQGEVKEDGVA